MIINDNYNRGDEIRTHDDRVKVGCLATWLHPFIYNSFTIQYIINNDKMRVTGIEPI